MTEQHACALDDPPTVHWHDDPSSSSSFRPTPPILYSPQAFGVWAQYSALASACCCLAFGPFSVLWWWYTIDPLYDPLLNLVAGGSSVVLAFVVVYEERTQHSLSRYQFRSLLYTLCSAPLMLSWPTLIPAATLLITAGINRLACAEGEVFVSRQSTNWLPAVDRVRILWSLPYFAGNAVLFAMTALSWHTQVEQDMSYWIVPAKAFGMLLDINCALVLLPVCRSLYQWPVLSFLLQLVPTHSVIAIVIVVASIGHTGAHLGNLALAYDWTMTTLEGPWALISGGFLALILFVICTASVGPVRLAQFSIFLEVHHLFLAFFALLLVHGAGGVGPNFWKYLIAPAVLYAGERLLRLYRGRQDVELLSVTRMQGVMCLTFSKVGVLKPPFRTGQYLRLQCPALSSLEWHPFTISSAPSDPVVTLHIKISSLKPSSFTYRLSAYLGLMRQHSSEELVFIPFDRPGTSGRLPGRLTGPDGRPLFHIDGPYSAPTQHIAESAVCLVIGAGIGSTALSACLRQVVHHDWSKSVGECFPSHAYFVWVVPHRDIHSFRWLIQLIRETQDRVHHMRSVGGMREKTFQFHIYVTSVPDASERAKGLAALWAEDAEYELMSEMVDPDIAAKWPAECDVFVYSGRPDWTLLFDSLSFRHPASPARVMFCGPPGVGSDVREQCERLHFKLHSEVY